MSDLNTLVHQVYSYFQNRYGVNGANPTARSLFLAFEQIGTTVSPNDFKCNATDATFNSALIQQHGSHLVDFVANITADGFIEPRGDLSPTVQAGYQQVLNSAKYPTADPESLAAFMALQGQTQREFDEEKANVDMIDFWPAQFTPQFWFDQTDPQNWSSYSTSTATATSSPPPPPVLRVPAWTWRVVTPEVRPVFSAMRAEALRPVTPAANAATMPAATHVTSFATVAPAALQARPTALASANQKLNIASENLAVRSISISAAATPAVRPTVRPVLENHAVLAAILLPQVAPNSDQFSLSFDYCLVSVSRPWLSANFLTHPGWYLPGEAASSWCSGTYNTATQRFAYLPAKMLVIKNLKVNAQWSQEDRTRLQSVAGLGPFSLLNYQFENDTLVAPGMQIIGWMCQVMPPFPPASDPHL
jgi:hypothetical protein